MESLQTRVKYVKYSYILLFVTTTTRVYISIETDSLVFTLRIRKHVDTSCRVLNYILQFRSHTRGIVSVFILNFFFEYIFYNTRAYTRHGTSRNNVNT